MLSCKDTSRLVSQAFDRRLSWWERGRVRLHLLICTACTRCQRQLEFLHAAARQYARHGGLIEPPTRLSPEARTRIRHALERHRA